MCDAGADPRTSNRVGVTPLHSAAEKDAADVALVLLRHGADVGAANAVGDTPLHWAAEKGHTGAARALLSAGADVRRGNKYGSTPLHAAASGTGEPALVDLLLRFGADPQAVDGHGQTPAEVAVTEGVRDALLGRQSSTPVHSPAAHSQQLHSHHVYEGSPPGGLSPHAAAPESPLRRAADARYDAVGEEMLSPWSPRVAGRLSAATEKSGLPAEWLPDGSTSRALARPAAAADYTAPPAPPPVAAPGSHGSEETQIAIATALAELQQTRGSALDALHPALEQAQAAVPVYQAAAGVAHQLRLLRMASSLRADADATRRLADSLAQAHMLADASRTTLVQRRAAVRAVLASEAAEPAVGRAASERDRAQAAHKATVARSAALALQLAEAQQDRAEVVAALVESAGDSDQAEAPGTGDADEAAALARAMVEAAAATLAPACERTARAAQALLDALHDEAAQCAQVAESMAQALSTARGASAAAAAAVQQETPAADASAARALAQAASTELACLAALEEQRAAGSAASMQLRGIAEARLEAQLAAEELQSEARKARLRGSWPPGRQAAHAAAEQQCAAMLRAYDQDAAALAASLQGAPLELAYPELTPARARVPEAGGTPVDMLTRAAVEELETMRRTERCALLRVAWHGAPGAAVTLKVLPGRGGDAFAAQAARLQGVRHPLVLPVLGAFTDAAGDACLLLPLQPRGSVRSAAEAHMASPGGQGDGAWAAWRTVLRQVMQALARLHQGGITHGAVHWDNVLWASDADDAGVVLADARAGGGDEAWDSDIAAVGTLARTLCARAPDGAPGATLLAELAQACQSPGMQASCALLHPGCGALDQVPDQVPCPLATAMRSLADAAATATASAGTLRVEVSSEGSLVRDVLLAHEEADPQALARSWHITVGGVAQPPCGPITRLLAALLDPELGLFCAPPAPAGGHDGLGRHPLVLPCPDDAPPCQRAVGLPRVRALRAVGRVLAKAVLSGVGTLPLELLPCAYSALLDPEAAQQQLLADPAAALAALALWDGPAAAGLAHTLACRAQAGATDSAKAATVASAAVAQLLGCRAGSMRSLSRGFLEAVGSHAQGDALCSALRATPQPAFALPAVMNCTAHVAVAPMVTALLWADSWPAEAPVKEHLVAWLRRASDVMRALFSVRAWGSLHPPQSLLLILPGRPGVQAATFGGDRTLQLPPGAGEDELSRLLVASLLQM